MKKTSGAPTSPGTAATAATLAPPPGALPLVAEGQRLITEQDEFLEPVEWEHRPALEEVKRRVGITHRFYDAWVYKFLENKNFDIEETVAKLERRTQMERTDLMTYEVTDEMRQTMRSGVMQLIGTDLEGRVTFYVVTARDFPKPEIRKMRTQNFDMWMSYGCRIRPIDAKCRICLLINQKDAGVWANTDMTFQSNIALRIAKFYPGVVDRAYVCNMGRALSAVARPVISAFPKVISERIFIYSESDVKKGKLLELFDPAVLPIALGGKNDCDHPASYQLFCETIERYFAAMKAALQTGKSVKEWELETALSECRQVERARAQAAQDAADEAEDAAMERQRQQQQHQQPQPQPQRSRRVSGLSRHQHPSPPATGHRSASDRGLSNAPDSVDLGGDVSLHGSSTHAGSTSVPNQRGQSAFSAVDGRSDSPIVPMASADAAASTGIVIGGVINVRQPREGAAGLGSASDGASDFDDDDDDLQTAMSESGHYAAGDSVDALSASRRSRGLRRGASFNSVCSRLSSTYNPGQRLGIAGFDALIDRPLYSNDRPLVSSVSTRRARYYVGPSSGADSAMVTARTPRGVGLSVGSIGDSLSKLVAQEAFFRRMFERWQQEQTDFLRGQLTRTMRAADGDMLTGTMAGGAGERWIIHRLPPHLRAFAYWIVAWICVWVAIFCFLAAIFVQLQIGSLVVIMWTTLFNSAYLIFPLGFSMLLLGTQGVLYGARGYELSRSLMRGNIAPPLQGLGSAGIMLQCFLTISVVVVQFVTFAVYASIRDPIEGLRIGFSTGLYSCAILILAYHALFPLGIGGVEDDMSGTHASAEAARRASLGLQLYLFFNVTEGAESRRPPRAGEARSIPTSAAILAALPVVLSFVFGVCVMLDFALVWVVLFVISDAAAVASVNHFFAERVNSLASNLTRLCAWLVGLFWLFTCFSVALIPMTPAWKAALAVPGCILACMSALAYTTHHLPVGSASHRVALRGAYVIIVAAAVAAIGVLFSIHWLLGLFGIILSAHSLWCRVRPSAIPGPGSVFTQILIMELILLAVILFAMSFRQPDNVATMLRPVASTAAPVTSSRDEWLSFIDTPTVCTLTYPLYVPVGATARSLHVSDFALISALSYGLNETQLAGDVQLALPGFEYKGRLMELDSVQLDRYSDADNNTILAVRYSPGNIQAIQGVAQWTEAIGLLPYAVLMPTNWIASVVNGLTKVSRLMDTKTIDEVSVAVDTVAAFQRSLLNNATPSVYPHLFLTGHSVSGGIASVLGARCGILAVTFSNPGLLYTGAKFDVEAGQYDRFVTSIRSNNDALGYVDKHGANTQEIGCGGDTAQCSEVKTAVCKLQSMCGDANGYTVTKCDL